MLGSKIYLDYLMVLMELIVDLVDVDVSLIPRRDLANGVEHVLAAEIFLDIDLVCYLQ
jgi:hypothetical protein